MKTFLLILTLSLAALLPAAPPQGAAEDKPAPAKVEGKTNQTPFGPARNRAPETAPQQARRAAPSVDVEVADGVATFQRQTPFGVQTWQRKTTELSAAEKQMLDDSEAARSEPADEIAPAQAAPPAAKAETPAADSKKPMIITPRP